jgi:hypothetical protein
MIENTARLHTAEAAVGVDIEHAVHVSNGDGFPQIPTFPTWEGPSLTS